MMRTVSGVVGNRQNGNTRGDPIRAAVWVIVGTGIGLATLLLALASLFSGRLDDVNLRLNDVNSHLNSRMDDMNGRMDDMNARMDDIQADIRELRALVIQALNETPPAD